MPNAIMTGLHAAGKGSQPDAIFSISNSAKEAAARLGKDKVVNASIGAIYDEEEKFAFFSSVKRYLRQLDPEEMMNYAPIAGLPEFQQAALQDTFQGYQPDNTFMKVVATPGGTGAIRNVFYNYLDQGQKVLLPDWFWGNYRTIAEEAQRSIDTYQMFDENHNFNVDGVREKMREILCSQDHLVIVFNTPAHNPTGYSITEDVWAKILDAIKNCASDQAKKVTLLLDIAYIDYAGNAEETRKFFRLFTGLPDNILVTIAYSMSKSYLIYGMRSGALIAISSSQDVVEEFYRVNSASNRSIWSNGNRGAQRLLVDVWRDPVLRSAIDKERTNYRNMMFKRAHIFMEEAKEVGLRVFPYHSGFFITVPAENPLQATKRIAQDQIYALHLNKGIRIAICGIPSSKIPGMAFKIKNALKN